MDSKPCNPSVPPAISDSFCPGPVNPHTRPPIPSLNLSGVFPCSLHRFSLYCTLLPRLGRAIALFCANLATWRVLSAFKCGFIGAAEVHQGGYAAPSCRLSLIACNSRRFTYANSADFPFGTCEEISSAR